MTQSRGKPSISIVTGAAGFIGSHLTDLILASGGQVLGIDSLLRGSEIHLASARKNPGFQFLEEDLSEPKNWAQLIRNRIGSEPIGAIWHMAANSDIPAGILDPEVDLRHTFLTTYQCLRMAREAKVPHFYFASSSAVYGERNDPLGESSGPFFPISNYGAMKLASEGAISAALESHLERAWIFRFPNVVGSRATHGVIHDFLKKLKTDPTKLEVLGNGNQEKPFLHVDDLLGAMRIAAEKSPDRLSCYNIGQAGTRTKVRTIAERVVRAVAPEARIEFKGGDRGWKGDIPRFDFLIDRISSLGWNPSLSSDQAVERAVGEIAKEMGHLP